ncbi:unnamed protein product [Adineta ricciae]|uniref:Uncharacterized protein n=1 Tax=Adineta ricciae TaxID=249248 RepID=A0A813QVF2_ADIRI|nr:unnamed protein product [Adineta ricciae]
MDWTAAKSYHIGYSLIDRLNSIIFFHNYFQTWCIGVIVSFILPILFIVAPSSVQSKRTELFLMICLVCLANMCCILIQPYMLSGSGEPNLSIHMCRFLVYISTFAKPFGLYLTLLFSIERIFTKYLSKTVFPTNRHHSLFRKIFLLSIILTICSVLSVRLYEVIKFVENTSSGNNATSGRIADSTNYNSSESILTFQYCYRLMNIGTYGEIISFYIIQYRFEYVIFALIALILLWMLIAQCCLPRARQRPLGSLSVNTKFYLSLASSVLLFELVLRLLHMSFDDSDYDNTQTQINYLQTMMFVYNFRCIFLPLVICMVLCDPLKQWLNEYFLKHSYADQLDATDQIETMTGH